MPDNSTQEPTDKQKLEAALQLIERFNGGMERRLPWNEIREIIDLISEEHLFLGPIYLTRCSIEAGS